MGDIFKLTSTFLGSLTLIMALVLMVSILQRLERKWLTGPFAKGLLFAFAVFMTMSDPIQLHYGGIFDMRGLLIGSAAALFGPLPGALALIAGILMRWHIGGTGVEAGIVGMLASYGAGLAWRYTIKESGLSTSQKSVTLGVVITSQMVGIFCAPMSAWAELFIQLTPYTLVTNVVGVLLINHLISGELSFQSEAESTRHAANTDHLTGLLNRRGLDHVLPSLKTEFTSNRGRALLYFDIDHFKQANDTFGHAVGDDVLTQVSARVSENLRRHDVFARMGGDEFAIILPDVDAIEAHHIAERCRAVVADEEFTHATGQGRITISLGAVWLHEPNGIDLMLKAADHALYQAKHGGRNAVVFLSSLRDIALCVERSKIDPVVA